MLTDFVEAGDNVAEVDPGCPSFCHLVEQVIPEKLQQVAVTRLWPRWVLLKPEPHSTKSQSSKTTTDPIPMDVTKVLLTLAARWWCPIWLTSGRDGHFVPPAKKKNNKIKKNPTLKQRRTGWKGQTRRSNGSSKFLRYVKTAETSFLSHNHLTSTENWFALF